MKTEAAIAFALMPEPRTATCKVSCGNPYVEFVLSGNGVSADLLAGQVREREGEGAKLV
jgi:hypothetical protein